MPCRRGAAHGEGGMPRVSPAAREPAAVRWTLIVLALGFLGLFVVLPVVSVFAQALEKGLRGYWAAIGGPETRAAIKLTLITAAIAVPLNTVFGVAAAWLI